MADQYPPPDQRPDQPYQPYGQPEQQAQYGQYGPSGAAPGYPAVPPYGYSPAAPFGIDPLTGIPYSEKTKVIAGVLQLVIPLGIGRMYMGNVGLGVAQLLVTLFTCGIGALWPFIDGILLLVGHPRDAEGRPLR